VAAHFFLNDRKYKQENFVAKCFITQGPGKTSCYSRKNATQTYVSVLVARVVARRRLTSRTRFRDAMHIIQTKDAPPANPLRRSARQHANTPRGDRTNAEQDIPGIML
jgi:hypothetical protein